MNTHLKCNRSNARQGYHLVYALSALFLSFACFSQTEKPLTTTYITSKAKATHTLVNHLKYKVLDEARWQHRVLIVNAADKAELESLEQTFTQNLAALNERKLLIIAVVEKNVYAYSESKFHQSNIDAKTLISKLRGKTALLIGLDGGNKAVYEKVDLKQVFAEIDGMPMRRQELREQ